mgnify:CR=1 FL=1
MKGKPKRLSVYLDGERQNEILEKVGEYLQKNQWEFGFQKLNTSTIFNLCLQIVYELFVIDGEEKVFSERIHEIKQTKFNNQIISNGLNGEELQSLLKQIQELQVHVSIGLYVGLANFLKQSNQSSFKLEDLKGIESDIQEMTSEQVELLSQISKIM